MIKRWILKLTAFRERMQVPLEPPPVLEVDDELVPQAQSFMLLLRFIRWVNTDMGVIMSMGLVLLPGGIIWAALRPNWGEALSVAGIAGLGTVIGGTGAYLVHLGLQFPLALRGEGRPLAWILRRTVLAGIPGMLLVFGTTLRTAWMFKSGNTTWDDNLLLFLFIGPAIASPVAAFYVLLRYREVLFVIQEVPPDKFERLHRPFAEDEFDDDDEDFLEELENRR